MAARALNILSLCSGAGGLELGLHAAEPRARTVCYVEREAYAAACLVARMEDAALDNAPIWDDVATFDATAWRGLVDIVTSGDPCQPNSVAGKGLGTDDDRWLAEHIVRILPLFAPGPADPRWPDILERVPHLEPAVRRVADGLAARMDRLRLTGNGVVPLQAAYAYRTLSALLAEASTGEPVR